MSQHSTGYDGKPGADKVLIATPPYDNTPHNGPKGSNDYANTSYPTVNDFSA